MRNHAEAKLLALIESTEDLIWSVDRDYRLNTFNRALERAFEISYGIRPAAGMLPEDLLPPEKAAIFPPLYERALAEGPFRTEYITRDGRTIEMAFNPIVAGGEKTGISVFGKDITERKLAEAKLRDSEARYRTAFQTSIDPFCLTRLSDGEFIDVNRAFLEVMGYARDELVGHSTLELGIWADPHERQNAVEALRKNSAFRDMEARFRKKNGNIMSVMLSASVIEIEGVSCLLGYLRDLTDAKAAALKLEKAQEAIRTNEARYRTVFQTSQDGIAISRLDDGRYIDVNQAFLRMLNFERDEVIGRTSQEIGAWTDLRIRQEIVEVLLRDSSFRNLTIPYRRKSGEIFWMQLSASVIEIDGVSCILSVTRDTSEIRAAEQRIKDLAFYDQLTHLPNRRLLLDRLEGTSGTVAGDLRERALLFLDLDEFTKLNDTLGHQAGDLLLHEVARRLTACVRGADTVARCGGDEFAVLLEGLGRIPEPAATQAQIVAANIVAAVRQPYLLAGHEYHCHCSIGITVFGSEPASPHQVLQQAELALHQAKNEGHNATRFFAPHLQAAADARAAIEQDLHQALNRKQFLLYYQPQVGPAGLIGAEALIRWNHPARGLLAPDEFIPLAEETGLILPIGEWVLETACRQIAAWAHRRQTAHLALAVNISARQFRQPEFVDQVLAVLYRTGANPGNLKLELTESMLLEEVEDVIAKMSVLKSHRLGFSLDDFGTGYSSLSYLKRLPLDQLKIDRAFVRDILVDVTSGAIAQTIVSLSRAMGLSVIAEGVETEEQRVFLAALGCHEFQGYLFGRPLPLEGFERLWLGSA
jgi:diguanylate cyclase (GGDEF)-like protein/PAS domain S-box-containing protein